MIGCPAPLGPDQPFTEQRGRDLTLTGASDDAVKSLDHLRPTQTPLLSLAQRHRKLSPLHEHSQPAQGQKLRRDPGQPGQDDARADRSVQDGTGENIDPDMETTKSDQDMLALPGSRLHEQIAGDIHEIDGVACAAICRFCDDMQDMWIAVCPPEDPGDTGRAIF